MIILYFKKTIWWKGGEIALNSGDGGGTFMRGHGGQNYIMTL